MWIEQIVMKVDLSKVSFEDVSQEVKDILIPVYEANVKQRWENEQVIMCINDNYYYINTKTGTVKKMVEKEEN